MSKELWGSVYQRPAGGVVKKDDIAAFDQRVSKHMREGSTRLWRAMNTFYQDRAA